MKNAIVRVLKYFSFFDYPPTFEEIYTFLPKKTTRKELKKELERLVNKKIIVNWKLEIENCLRYTLGEYGIRNIKYQISNSKYKNSKLKIQNSKFKACYQIVKQSNKKQLITNYELRYKASLEKINLFRFRLYLKFLSFFPQIKLVGLSGSLAMMNATKDDDIDLFIITAKNRLFTGRFIAVILAKLLGIYRKRKCFTFHALCFTNKICLNLFFDESDLEVPDFKKNEYVAHEILQMKPIINKSYTYEKFLLANRWVKKIFPNTEQLILKIKDQRSCLPTGTAKIHIKYQKYFLFLIHIFDILYLIFNIIQDWWENLFKSFQLYFIKKHKTSEIITDFQLWFHPEDFGRKIPKLIQ